MSTDNTPNANPTTDPDELLSRIPRRSPKPFAQPSGGGAQPIVSSNPRAAGSMNRTALGAAFGVALAVAGGVSALFFTVGQGVDGPPPATTAEVVADATPVAATPEVVIEYVDQYGNPIAEPSVAANPTPVVAAQDQLRAAAGTPGEPEAEEEHDDDEDDD